MVILEVRGVGQRKTERERNVRGMRKCGMESGRGGRKNRRLKRGGEWKGRGRVESSGQEAKG